MQLLRKLRPQSPVVASAPESHQAHKGKGTNAGTDLSQLRRQSRIKGAGPIFPTLRREERRGAEEEPMAASVHAEVETAAGGEQKVHVLNVDEAPHPVPQSSAVGYSFTDPGLWMPLEWRFFLKIF